MVYRSIKFPQIRLAILVILLFTGASGWNAFAYSNSDRAAAWQKKVDPRVLASATSGETDFLVFLDKQADLSGAAALTTKEEKGAYVFQQLTAVASRTQKSLINTLEKQKVDYRPYWVVNMVWVHGGITAVQSMASRSDIGYIYADPWIKNDLEATSHSARLSSAQGIEWNISKVNAPQVWAAGYTGQGAVIGGQDTGYQWDHPALKAKYRGWDGATADHDYNWHDAIHASSANGVTANSCGYDLTAPCDDNGHGTHTMGTMVGDDGGAHQIGMAPGAKWIGCRNMESGIGKPSTYAECFQWFIAPWPIGGDPVADADPSKAPDVISNSWACPPSEGCAWDALQTAVNNTRSAGIMVVGSAGNNGSSCGSVNNPIAIYDSTFSIGSTDSNDIIAGSSSRGPSTNTNLLKPDVSAPGVNIYSSLPGNGYGTKSGTSMAAPHVAGLAALLISANPGLAGQVDTLEGIIKQTTVPLTITTQDCGGVSGLSVPNNTYGWGRIKAYAAYQQVHRLAITKTASTSTISPGDLITYTLTVTHSLSLNPTTGVVITDVLPEHTVCISATTPYTYTDGQILWKIPNLAANTTQDILLTVQVPLTYTGIVVNNDFGVKSDDFLIPTLGDPVLVLSGKFQLYLPIILNP